MAAQTWHGQVVARAWRCPFTDDAGQPCVLPNGHGDPHRDSGLRAWLESTFATAVVRTYEGEQAQQVYEVEVPLFARFGWRPIAAEDTHRLVKNLSRDAIVLLGSMSLATTTTSEVRRITVCFARPPLVTQEG